MALYSARDMSRFKTISKRLSVFGFGQVQDVLTVLVILKEYEISIGEFMSWVRYMQDPLTKKTHSMSLKDKSNTYYKCPLCEMPLILANVNSSSCTQVGCDYLSMFSCLDDFGCGYSRYSKKSVDYWIEITKKIGERNISLQGRKGLLDREKNISKSESSVRKKEKCSGCGKK